MGIKQTKILTSVYLDSGLFHDFKIEKVRTKITLQELTERSMYLFLNNPEFKSIIKNQHNI